MYDVLIRGGTVIDGTGSPGLRQDVAIKDGKIAALANNVRDTATTTIDAGGQIVAPGFIDTHSHSDLMLLANPALEEKVRQGVTTEILGQDGLGLAPVYSDTAKAMLQEHLAGLLGSPAVVWNWSSFASYLKCYQHRGTILNVAALVSHGALRIAAMGMEDRPATKVELAEMKRLLDEALATGAPGLSTGLIYPPCNYATHEELVELARVVASHGGAFVVHVRNEADTLLESLQEMVDLARASGVHLHISHLKTIGKKNWGKVDAALTLLETAQQEGLVVTADQYPYLAGSTALAACLPPWAPAGGPQAMLARLRSPEERARIKAAFRETIPNWQNRGETEGWENVIVASLGSGNPAVIGKSIAQLAAERGADPVDVIMDIILAEENRATMVCFQNCEENLVKVMQKPWVMVCTDGILGAGKPHPRLYGTFPRVLGRYVREQGALTLEEAIRKMTALPAASFGLTDRGVLKEGLAADVVVFEPAVVLDRATYAEPQAWPEGISHVLVNGELVLAEGMPTGALPGRVLAGKRSMIQQGGEPDASSGSRS
ncbi:amidohydrolase family protein [Gelria sp. Kuro-4]|uniref:N-acyl-D-amino-acid deacylase family protein n=1 Tax=Gelria sp. Kuro-4 TaxID=2796927 RepID=UPI001BEEF64F|nr:D-aminoacylase [Gelria sp. Kuro-4]BCV24862.1 D-aminoacylase [Gelria sp. Kuro-4]